MFFVRFVTGHLCVLSSCGCGWFITLVQEVVEFKSFYLKCMECVETKTTGWSWGPILFDFYF